MGGAVVGGLSCFETIPEIAGDEGVAFERGRIDGEESADGEVRGNGFDLGEGGDGGGSEGEAWGMEDEIGKLAEGDFPVEEAEKVDEGLVGAVLQVLGVFGHEETGVRSGAAVFVNDERILSETSGAAVVGFSQIAADQAKCEWVALAEITEPPEIGR